MSVTRISGLLGKITILVFICFFALSAKGKYGGGTGEPNDPYLIYTAEQMNEIGQGENWDDWDKCFKLMANIDLGSYTGTEFNIIGIDSYNPFTGFFDGNGHTISNFTYDSNGVNYIGLFGYVGNFYAGIKNLGLIDPNVDAGTGEYVGSLAGYLYSGTITDCYVEGGSVSGGGGVGGLVGDSTGTISHCYSTGGVSGASLVGGLVGHNYGTIANCYSSGSVTGDCNVGGLAGGNNGTITNCYSSGGVLGVDQVGGLTGGNHGTITNCYASGSVIGDNDVGGLVGYNENGDVTYSFWDVETSGQATSAGGTGNTTAEMQMVRTFVAWGCDPVWTIDEGNDYPRLAWENKPGEPITVLSGLNGGGTGEPNDPYLIYTAEQLNVIGLVQCVWNQHFKLMADIDLSSHTGTSFNIIGIYRDHPFTGVFDGNGHTISNFTYTFTDRDNTGFFGYVDDPDAEIKNLGLVDPNVDTGMGNNVGSLVGYNSGNITNCYVKGGSVSGYRSVGGLVGGNDGIITNCCSTCRATGDKYVGGMVGSNWGAIINSFSTSDVSGRSSVGGLVGVNESGIITNCYSSNVNTSGISAIGGLVGVNESGIITNCYSSNVNTSGISAIGGLVGDNDGTITGCSSIGDISGSDAVGGLVGVNDGFISNCYFIGNVNGGAHVGGLAGYNNETITNCYASVTIIASGFNVGGLVGYNSGGGPTRGTIIECYADGSVYGGFTHTGGLAGFNSYRITNCYSRVNVTGSGDYVGGIVGRANNDSNLTNCYAAGRVVGYGSYIGGILGYTDSSDSLSTCYWDIETSGLNNMCGDGDCNDLNGKTTSEMQQKSTFTDWDFVDIWTICEGTNYPRFFWQINASDLLCPEGVDFIDYSFFSLHWQEENSDSSKDYEGANLNQIGTVDIHDLAIFVNSWLTGVKVGLPPSHVGNPNPANGANSVSITADLIWTAGPGAISHDVYFGTSNPLPFMVNKTSTTFDPGTMAYSTRYYWRIDEVGVYGTIKGAVWNFSTTFPPPP